LITKSSELWRLRIVPSFWFSSAIRCPPMPIAIAPSPPGLPRRSKITPFACANPARSFAIAGTTVEGSRKIDSRMYATCLSSQRAS